ncbi:MAG: GAF domain-containing protein [Anaerolineae bacterium]|nr:GAF domain-containing protein [Anaerolineae bacterium]
MTLAPNINAAHILIAVRDPDLMDHIYHLLAQGGYNIHKAYYADDAVYELQQRLHHLALLDIEIRDRDQTPLIDHMIRFPRTRWIALVDKDHSSPKHFLHQGASAYIRYPIQSDILLSHVANVLKGQKMSTQSLTRSIPPRSDNAQIALERRLMEQQTLSTLTRSLSAVLDLDTLLTQVVDAAVRLSNAEEGLLLLPDDEGKALYVRAVKGIDSETARNFRIKTQDTLAGKVFHSGQPILVGDQGLQKVKTEYLVKSLLYVPLSSKGETIGVLGVNNKNADRTFSEHDADLLHDLAAHAAVAIENARLYEDSVLRTRELSTLVQASRTANSTLAIDQVLSIIAGQLIGALDIGHCYIGEWNAEQQRLDTLSVTERAIWQPGNGPAVSIKHHPAIAEAVQTKRVATDIPALSRPLPPFAASLPHRYLCQHRAYVPLFAQERPLGMVQLYHIHAPERPPQIDQLQVQQMALEIAITLAGPNGQEQRKSLFRSAQRMLEATGAQWCEIALWDEATQTFYIALSYGDAIWGEKPQAGLDLRQFPRLSAILTGQKTLVGPPSDDLLYLADNVHGKSLLGMPLVIKGETAGLVLLVDARYDRRFSRREIDLARALSVQAANALSNARLYRDLELSLEELHHTQSRLVQTARLSAMGELAAAVAHQINNPLTTILGDAELILSDLPVEDVNHEALEAILRAGRRAHEVVRRLLAMARKQSADDLVEALDINQTISNTLTLVKSHIQQGNVTLAILLDENLPPVMAAQGQLEDVWLNLLLNARDAVVDHNDPKIGIATKYRPGEREIEVIVWDNGIGISPEKQAQVFEPFYTTKPAGEGTGLGLHICKQIIEKCGGSISLQSTYNEGTCFTIRLPAFNRRNTA